MQSAMRLLLYGSKFHRPHAARISAARQFAGPFVSLQPEGCLDLASSAASLCCIRVIAEWITFAEAATSESGNSLAIGAYNQRHDRFFCRLEISCCGRISNFVSATTVCRKCTMSTAGAATGTAMQVAGNDRTAVGGGRRSAGRDGRSARFRGQLAGGTCTGLWNRERCGGSI